MEKPDFPDLPNLIVKPSTEKERTHAAAMTLCIFWGLALICLIIPFVNLVMTPLLFILGPFAAWKASQRIRSGFDPRSPATFSTRIKSAQESGIVKARERHRRKHAS